MTLYNLLMNDISVRSGVARPGATDNDYYTYTANGQCTHAASAVAPAAALPHCAPHCPTAALAHERAAALPRRRTTALPTLVDLVWPAAGAGLAVGECYRFRWAYFGKGMKRWSACSSVPLWPRDAQHPATPQYCTALHSSYRTALHRTRTRTGRSVDGLVFAPPSFTHAGMAGRGGAPRLGGASD